MGADESALDRRKAVFASEVDLRCHKELAKLTPSTTVVIYVWKLSTTIDRLLGGHPLKLVGTDCNGRWI
jgi:hypothetical protein